MVLTGVGARTDVTTRGISVMGQRGKSSEEKKKKMPLDIELDPANLWLCSLKETYSKKPSQDVIKQVDGILTWLRSIDIWVKRKQYGSLSEVYKRV